MAILPDYVTGTITLTNGSTAVTGTGTAWNAAPIRAGDIIFYVQGAEQWQAVVGVDATSATALTLAAPWPGPTSTNKTYRIRFQPDGSRYSAAAAQLVQQMANGNLPAFAALVGAPGKVPVFSGPGAMTLLNATELVNGVVYDKMVNTIAARAAYNAAAAGYSVLVANVGDGRAALYTKNTATSGDWSDPAYITGGALTISIGDVTGVAYDEEPTVTVTPVSGGIELDFGIPLAPTIAIGTVTTGAPGTNASASFSPTGTGYALSMSIPRGEGFTSKGAYAGGTAYVKGDVVLYNGSSYIAKSATTGNLPTNATFWNLLSQAGADGTNGTNGTSLVARGAYNAGTAYVPGDVVSYNGSSYINSVASTGQVPTNGAYWTLLALKGTDGIDGSGVVSSIVEGNGVNVDDTDPTNPIVSVAFEDSLVAYRGHIYGLGIANNATDATNDIDIAAGEAAAEGSASFPRLIALTGGVTRQLDIAFGTGNGGRFDSAISDGTWHVFVIMNAAGTVNAGFSKSLVPTSAPNYPAGYIYYRRIASFTRSSSAIDAFVQVGDRFMLNTPRASVSVTNASAGATLRNMWVPLGIKVECLFMMGLTGATSTQYVFVNDPDQPAYAPSGTLFMLVATTSLLQATLGSCMTNTAQQVRSNTAHSAAGTSNALYMTSLGWIDKRGQI